MSTRAKSIGSVDVAISRTPSGKVRARLMFSIEQLEAMLEAARNGDVDDDEDHPQGPERKAKPEPEPTPAQSVFVREGTRAWAAWLAHKRRTNPVWYLTKESTIDGKRFTGWWFPTLFPPGTDTAATGPPEGLSADDEAIVANGFK